MKKIKILILIFFLTVIFLFTYFFFFNNKSQYKLDNNTDSVIFSNYEAYEKYIDSLDRNYRIDYMRIDKEDFDNYNYAIINYYVENCNKEIIKYNYEEKNKNLNVYLDIKNVCSSCFPYYESKLIKISKDILNINVYYKYLNSKNCK